MHAKADKYGLAVLAAWNKLLRMGVVQPSAYTNRLFSTHKSTTE